MHNEAIIMSMETALSAIWVSRIHPKADLGISYWEMGFATGICSLLLGGKNQFSDEWNRLYQVDIERVKATVCYLTGTIHGKCFSLDVWHCQVTPSS